MTYFNELHAPDLSDLAPPLSVRLINGLLFHGKEAPTDTTLSRLLTGYVMVTDKAIREYEAGRNALVAYSNSQNELLIMLDGVGRMETCISSAKRALRLLGRIGTTKSPLAVDRTLRKLAQSPEKAITSIRDAIEHIDGVIVHGPTLKPGDAHLLAIDHAGKYLEIGNERMTFDAMARSLRSLHNTGVQMLDALPSRT